MVDQRQRHAGATSRGVRRRLTGSPVPVGLLHSEPASAGGDEEPLTRKQGPANSTWSPLCAPPSDPRQWAACTGIRKGAKQAQSRLRPGPKGASSG